MPQPAKHYRSSADEQSPKYRRNAGSPKKYSQLYPSLDDTLSDDEGDESWNMSRDDITKSMTETDYISSSCVDDSPEGLRRSRYGSDTSFGSPPRLRSGKCYGVNSGSDFSDDHVSFSKSPKSPRTKQKSTQSSLSPSLILASLVGFIITCALIYFFILADRDPPVDNSNPNVYDQFRQQMSTIKSRFPSQSGKSWKILNVATKHILTDQDPIYPAVILMVGSSQTLPVMNCISSQIISLVNSLYNITNSNGNSASIHVSELNRRSADLEKLDLDQRLHRLFSAGYKGAALVNLENLSPLAALMLHSYCDNDHAPYKKVILILQLTTDSVSLEESSLDRSVENYLRDLWEGDLGVDRQMALLSRIANNIMLVYPEEPKVLAAACG